MSAIKCTDSSSVSEADYSKQELDLTKMQRRNKSSLYICLLAFSFGVYVLLWSSISIDRLYSFNSSIYDLGITVESAWTIVNTKLTFLQILFALFVRGGSYLLIPFSFTNDYRYVLIFQTIIIGAGAFPIYGISKILTKNKFYSFVISETYFFNFMLAGSNWFDIHLQAFFPIFFLVGYYLITSKRYFYGYILLLISGLMRFPLMVFPILYFMISIISLYRSRSNSNTRDSRSYYLPTIFLLVSIVFLIIGAFLNSTFGFSTISNLHINSSSQNVISNIFTIHNLHSVLITLFIVFLSVGFVPLIFPNKNLIMLVPFVILMAVAVEFAYYYPVLVTGQYGSEIYPFLYLSTISSIASLTNAERNVNLKDAGFKKRRFIKRYKKMSRIALAMLVTGVIIGAVFFEPYGPLNPKSAANFGYQEESHYNLSDFSTLESVVSLIPRNNPYVLFQNDIPEILPRTQIDGYLLLDMPYVQFGNISHSDVLKNTFPVFGERGLVYTNIDYVIAYVNAPSYIFFAGNPNMFTLLNIIYNSGLYGILAESNGFVVLERGYSGHPVIYSNVTHKLSAAVFYNALSDKLIGENEFNLSNISPVPQSYYNWFGPYITLPPGAYSVTFEFYTTDNSSLNRGYLDVSSNDRMRVLNSTEIFGHLLKNDSNSFITIQFYLANFTQGIEFRGYQFHWNGTLFFKGVTFHRLSSNRSYELIGYPHSENNIYKDLNALRFLCQEESETLIKTFSGDNL